MELSQELYAVVAGFGIGFITSFIGGVMSYMVYIRRNPGSASGVTGYVLVVTGVLFFIGAVAVIIALFTGQLMMAILTGVGVFIGFSLAFGLLFFVFIRSNQLYTL